MSKSLDLPPASAQLVAWSAYVPSCKSFDLTSALLLLPARLAPSSVKFLPVRPFYIFFSFPFTVLSLAIWADALLLLVSSIIVIPSPTLCAAALPVVTLTGPRLSVLWPLQTPQFLLLGTPLACTNAFSNCASPPHQLLAVASRIPPPCLVLQTMEFHVDLKTCQS